MTRQRTAGWAALLGVVACSTPTRYAVPASEVIGREIIGKSVLLGDKSDPMRVRILDAELAGITVEVNADDRRMDAALQQAARTQPDADVVLVTDYTLAWPSLVAAAIGGQIGMLIGEVVGILQVSAHQRSTTTGAGLFLPMFIGTAIGAIAGGFAGTAFAGRVRHSHLLPPSPAPRGTPDGAPRPEPQRVSPPASAEPPGPPDTDLVPPLPQPESPY